MSSFDDRKKGFEKKFAHDQELQFKVVLEEINILGSGLLRFLVMMKKKKKNISKQ